jgi:hypothetical protein
MREPVMERTREEPKVLRKPEDPRWMERLREGHYVWLPKERQYARIAYPYEVEEPGTCAGRVGLEKVWGLIFSPGVWGLDHIEQWFIRPDGSGLDHRQLVLPTEGNLPDDPPSLPEPLVRQMQRQIAALQTRVERLETELRLQRGYLE